MQKARESASIVPERETITNRHYLIQFGLQIIQTAIKVEKIKLDSTAAKDIEVSTI